MHSHSQFLLGLKHGLRLHTPLGQIFSDSSILIEMIKLYVMNMAVYLVQLYVHVKFNEAMQDDDKYTILSEHPLIRRVTLQYDVDPTKALSFVHLLVQKTFFGLAFGLSAKFTKQIYEIVKTKTSTRKPPIGEIITRITLVVTYLAIQGILVKIVSIFSGKFWVMVTDVLF